MLLGQLEWRVEVATPFVVDEVKHGVHGRGIRTRNPTGSSELQTKGVGRDC